MRISGHLPVLVACLAGLAMTAQAADTVRAAPLRTHDSVSGEQYDINDLRLTGGFLPKGNEVDGTGFSWSRHYRIALSGMRAGQPLEEYGGFIYGGEFAIDTARKNTP